MLTIAKLYSFSFSAYKCKTQQNCLKKKIFKLTSSFQKPDADF